MGGVLRIGSMVWFLYACGSCSMYFILCVVFPMGLFYQTSYGKTKINVFFSKYFIPYVAEPALVFGLKKWFVRNVEKHWSTLSANDPRWKDGPTDEKKASASFDIKLATMSEHGSRAEEITTMINQAYVRELRTALKSSEGTDDTALNASFSRTDATGLRRRLLTDSEVRGLRDGTFLANRVLFLAVEHGEPQLSSCGFCCHHMK